MKLRRPCTVQKGVHYLIGTFTIDVPYKCAQCELHSGEHGSQARNIGQAMVTPRAAPDMETQPGRRV